jgi:two-component system, OmpR family, phosphate regulon sensor histidine kinase PhoR
LVALIVGALTLAILAVRPFRQTDLWFRDLLYLPAQASDQIVIVAIDDKSFNAYGRAVALWSRTLHADLIKRLDQAEARVIGFDILFFEQTENDTQLITAMAQAKARIVTSYSVRSPVQTNRPLLTFRQAIYPLSTIFSVVDMAGHVNVLLDNDGAVRRIPLMIDANGYTSVAFGVANYLAYLRIPSDQIGRVVRLNGNTLQVAQRDVPLDHTGQALIDFFGGPNTFTSYSYKDVLDGRVDPAVFKDKIVLVGVMNSIALEDRYFTPTTRTGIPMSGVEIHANIIEGLLQNRTLRDQSSQSELFFVLGIGLLGSVLFISLSLLPGVIFFLLGIFAIFFIASLSFANGILVGVLYPVGVWGLAGFATTVAHVQMERVERKHAMALLNSANNLLDERMSLELVQKSIVQEVQRLSGKKAAALWLVDQNGGEPTLVYQENIGSLLKIVGIVKETMQQKRPISKDQVIAYPLVFQAVVLGAVSLDGKGKPSRPQMKACVQFCEGLGPVLANAQLYTAQQKQRQQLEAVLNGTTSPVLVVDDAGNLLQANPAAIQLFNIGANAYGEQFIALLKVAGTDEKTIEKIAIQLVKDAAFETETAILKRFFRLQASPLEMGFGWVLVLNDVTQLTELANLKQHLIRMASHDLKNPLAAIMGMTEMLLETAEDDDQKEMLETIESSGKRMLNIVTDLLNLERYSSGTARMEIVDLKLLVKVVSHDFAPQAAAKKQTFTFDIPEGSPVLIIGDKRQLQEAFANLVGNAIKYTPAQGTVTWGITLEKTHVVIRVVDTGYGIPKDAQAKLFQPFYRVRTEVTIDIEGTGLGLSLVKAVIEAHNGQISLESDAGKGSTFIVRLPLATKQQLEAAAAAAAIAESKEI